MDEHRLGDSEAAPVVSVAEAARRLGRTVDGVRGLVRRGKLSAKRGNDGKLLIVLPTGGDEAATGGDEADHETGALALLRDQLEEMRDQLENWRLAAARRLAWRSPKPKVNATRHRQWPWPRNRRPSG